MGKNLEKRSYFALAKYTVGCILLIMGRLDMETQLREALLTSDLSRYKIAQLTGVSNASLSLFVNAKRSLSLGAASLLADTLGFQLVREKRTRKSR